jgi:IS5 family transposase
MAGQPGFFDLDERYRALSESGDPLIRLTTLIDFEVCSGLRWFQL